MNGIQNKKITARMQICDIIGSPERTKVETTQDSGRYMKTGERIQEVITMKINKKISALVLAGALACTAPTMAYAQDSSDVVDQAVEVLQDNGVDELLSDPDQVVDLIIQAKGILGQVDVTNDEIGAALDTAAQSAGITLSDSEKATLIQLYDKFKNTDLNEEQLRSQVNKVYNKLEELGITKEDVKGIIGKLLDFARSILN